MSWLSLGLGYAFFYAVAVLALAEFPQVRAWLGAAAQLGAAVAVIAVVYQRRRDWTGCQRPFRGPARERTPTRSSGSRPTW